MEKGDKAFVVGLQNRQDLNGTTVNLLEWNQATGRWSARVASGRREGICIKPINLSAVPPLDPVMVSAISASVRGGDKIMSQFTEIGIIPGQVSYELFMTFTSLMVKAYGNTMTEAKATEMLIEHIGMFGDARLVCGKLKKIASDANDMTRFGIVIPTLSAMLRMDTGKGYLELMIRLREGTIAHIRSQQAHLRRFKSQVQEIRVQSDDPFQAAMKRMCGREGSKSMSPKHIAEELAWAGMTGDMTIIGEEGVEKVKFDMILHRAYVKWLVQDVLPTLDPRDAKDGTLGKWHQVLHWESQLTGSVFVTHDRVFLDISDDFRIDPWIDGLVKFNLKTLESMPGVDADRRILRFFLFSEVAFKATLVALDEHKGQQKSSGSAGEPVTGASANPVTVLEGGSKVVVVNVEADDDRYSEHVFNGMEGRIQSIVNGGEKYVVAFSNLENAQVIMGAHLARPAKVEREKMECRVCKEDANYLCVQCNVAWYCGPACQKADYKSHKKHFKLLSHDNMFDAMHSMTRDSDEHENVALHTYIVRPLKEGRIESNLIAIARY